MEYYNLGERIIAFTTDRSVGRDFSKIAEVMTHDFSCLREQRSSVPEEELVAYYPHQTHTDRVMVVDEAFLLLTPEEKKQQGEGIDALISCGAVARPGSCILGISTADCIPVIVYDEEHHAAAAIHAGWRGTQKRIVANAVEMMQREYGTVPARCRAVIGPGISMDSFEVGDEVYEAFAEAAFTMDDRVARRYPCRMGGERWHIDLKEINRREFNRLGVRSVEVSAIDTFTDTRFFSARREQKGDIKCGRILTGFVLL